MKSALWPILFLLLPLTLFSQQKQSKWEQHKKKSESSLTCLTCHVNDHPTASSPALVKCPRSKIMPPGYHKVEEGPEYLVLDEIANKFGPVIFAHKTHAHMAEMKDGCYGCHHYNEAKPIQPCKDYHSTLRIRTDITKPDLKGARHRQCIDCHLRWSKSVNCSACHSSKDVRNVIKGGKDLKKLKKNIYAKVQIPVKIVFETKSEKGKIVTFFHDEHANKFGLKCDDCHQDQNCVKCHEQKRKQTQSVKQLIKNTGAERKTMSELHRPCFTCHQDDKCTSCHSNKQKTGFDHEATSGWALNKYHINLSCNKCHGEKNKRKKPQRECVACHKDWSVKTFDHGKTGLVLNEIHAGNDCADCHPGKQFDKKTDCKNCHDDKSYPANMPGKLIKLVKNKK